MQMQILDSGTFLILDPGWKNADQGSGKTESTTEQHFHFSKIMLLKFKRRKFLSNLKGLEKAFKNVGLSGPTPTLIRVKNTPLSFHC